MIPRRTTALFALLLPLVAGARCGGGDGSGGSSVVVVQRSLDPRCAPLGDVGGFPPDFDFVPQAGGGAAPLRVLAASGTASNLVPFDVETIPFEIPTGTRNRVLPSDADGDGRADSFKSVGDVTVVSPSLALVTTSGVLEAVLFVDPGGVDLRAATVSIPADFDPAGFAAFAGLPAPGGARQQTGITTSACIDAGPEARDSGGARLADVLAPAVWCDGPGTFAASFTASAAIAGGRLFAATSNVGARQGAEDTQFLPGAVVAYEIDTASDPLAVSPTQATPDGRPSIVTGAFNPTHVQPYTTPAGRRLLLVTDTGAIGIRADDPNTDDIESGAVRLSDGAVDVIAVDTLERIATIPLEQANPSFVGVAIDPSGRVGLLGDVGARRLYAIDLAVLDGLPPAGSGDPPVVLDAAVVFDGRNPLALPALPGGAPVASCPGQITGVAFDDAGTHAYALESCDGTVIGIEVDLAGDPSLAELRSRFRVSSVSPATFPVRADTLGQPQLPSALAIRPGRPGIDYAGPDVFFLIDQPEGLLCGVRIDAP